MQHKILLFVDLLKIMSLDTFIFGISGSNYIVTSLEETIVTFEGLFCFASASDRGILS